MPRKITLIALLICSGLMFMATDTKALDLTHIESENCYVVSVSSYHFDDFGSDTLPQPIWQNIPVPSPIVKVYEQSLPSNSLITLLWDELDESLSSIGSAMAKTNLQSLPMPASLLFIAFWLIGFKLTNQPSPSLNRVEPSRFGKAYVVMNLAKKCDSAPC